MERVFRVLHLVKRTALEWVDDQAPTLAASLSFYTAFSIAPLLIIAVAVAGAVFGEEAAAGEIRFQLQGLLGDAAAKSVQELVASAARPGKGFWPTLLGVVVLVVGATGVFVELQLALNRIWNVPPSKKNGLWLFVRSRLLSLAMVLAIGFLLLVSLVVSAALSGFGTWATANVPGFQPIAQVVNTLVGLGVITLLFGVLFKVLPDVKVAWRDVWLGAFVSAVLFTLGKWGLGLYLGTGAIASSYGAAGSLAVLLTWVYFSSMLVLFGAELSQVVAEDRARLGKSAQGKSTDDGASGRGAIALGASTTVGHAP